MDVGGIMARFDHDTLTFIIKLLIALFLGAMIGLERQFSRQMAGIRTNILIALGSCLFTQFSFEYSGGDVFRIAAAIVTGIGFLGGGVIVRDGFTIKGLTTAATMWCTSAVGVAIACGLYIEGAAATVLIVCTNLLLHPISKRIRNRRMVAPSRAYQYHIIVACNDDDALHIRMSLGQIGESSRLMMKTFDQLFALTTGVTRYALLMQSDTEDAREVERLVSVILSQPGVISAAWDPVSEQE